jgi:flagellar basal-body rod protein FlgG
MTIQQQRQDQIANNLANVNTNGYKRQDIFASSIEKHLEDDAGRVSGQRVTRADEAYTDYSDGPIQETGSPLDFAIQGDGFFTVMRENGVSYTRDGAFSMNEDGFLITSSGDRVFGKEGFIRVDPSGGDVSVYSDGAVMQGDTEIGTLKIADFPRPYKLLKTGGNYFRPAADIEGNNMPRRAQDFKIHQGYLEKSNVQSINEMTDMIASHRIYESIAKAMQSEDQTLDKAVNSVGRVQ